MEEKQLIRRKGGPPRGRRVSRTFQMLPEMDEQLAKRAAEIGLSKGQYIEHLLRIVPPARVASATL